MNFPAHERAERAVHELMTLNRPLAFKLRRDNHRLEMRIVVRDNTCLRAGEPGFDQESDFRCVHCTHFAEMSGNGSLAAESSEQWDAHTK